MSIINIINLLGGLGLFLFGMNYMSEGINQVAGRSMKDLLEKLTRNRVKGFLLGVLVTAIIQSSSATTVMLMGFLNAGIMDLAQATGVILGAHIGTTVTAILIAIDVSAISTICIFIGSVLVLFSKKQNYKYVGQIILGFGILFFGLKYMSGDSAMGVLKSSEGFKSFIASANNPILGVLIGTVMCAILQSSSASVGVLQVLALQGFIPLQLSIFIILGINVGSATPLLLSSIGAKTNAKRAAVVYFMFDVIGCLIFFPINLLTPYASFIASLTSNGSVQVAIAHIIFKTVTAIVLLPFVHYLVSFAERVIKPQEHDTELRFKYIDPKILDPISLVPQLESEVDRMAQLVRANLIDGAEVFMTQSLENKAKMDERETIINWLNKNITEYVITVTSRTLPPRSSAYIGRLFHVLIDLERIGDYSYNLLIRTSNSLDEGLTYSDDAKEEFNQIFQNILVLYDESLKVMRRDKIFEEEKNALINMQKFIKELNNKALDTHIERLRNHECHTDSGVVFTKLLQDLEKSGDHSYNISKAGRDDQELIDRM